MNPKKRYCLLSPVVSDSFFPHQKLSHHFLWLCLRKKAFHVISWTLYTGFIKLHIASVNHFTLPLNHNRAREAAMHILFLNTTFGVIHVTLGLGPEKRHQLPSYLNMQKLTPREIRRYDKGFWLLRQKWDSNRFSFLGSLFSTLRSPFFPPLSSRALIKRKVSGTGNVCSLKT